jgi:hypothetical protein
MCCQTRLLHVVGRHLAFEWEPSGLQFSHGSLPLCLNRRRTVHFGEEHGMFQSWWFPFHHPCLSLRQRFRIRKWKGWSYQLCFPCLHLNPTAKDPEMVYLFPFPHAFACKCQRGVQMSVASESRRCRSCLSADIVRHQEVSKE